MRRYARGVALALGVALLAIALAALARALFDNHLIEALVLALLLGVIVRHVVRRPGPYLPGTQFCATSLLEIAVAILGAAVDLRLLADAGWRLVVLIVACVVTTILVGYMAGRAMHLSSRSASLIGVGNGVCGNSAIAAVAPVIGATRTEIAASIGLTAVLGVVLVLALPLAVPLFGLDNLQYGVLAGMSVYAVPQVVAAAFPVSELSGQIATVVKLARVMLLGPIVVAFALLYRGRTTGPKKGAGSYLPWFVMVFLVLAVLRSTGLLPETVAEPLGVVSRYLTILAMAGLGFDVDLRVIRHTGPRVAAAVLISLLFLVAITIALIPLLGISA